MVGVCENHNEVEWFTQEMTEDTREGFLAGTFTVPGVETVQAEMNPDLLSPFPEVPNMCRLLVVQAPEQDPSKAVLQLPRHLFKEWQTHEAFGHEFQE